MLEKLGLGKDDLSHTILWGLAMVCICVLVGLGKLKPETFEMMLFAVIGRAATSRKPGEPTNE